MLCVDLWQYEAGIAQYERALAADPKLAVVHYLVAEVLLMQPAAGAVKAQGVSSFPPDAAGSSRLTGTPGFTLTRPVEPTLSGSTTCVITLKGAPIGSARWRPLTNRRRRLLTASRF